MNAKSKQSILDEIAKLKREKPRDWKRTAKGLVWKLEHDDCVDIKFNMDTPFIEHLGRPARQAGGRNPSFDSMGDNSWP